MIGTLFVKSVKYERPRVAARDDYQWEFMATTDGLMPHGHDGYGGILRRTEFGWWQAKQESDDTWGAASATREGAISSYTPRAIERIKAHVNQMKLEKAEIEARANRTRNLTEAVREATTLPGTINIYDSNTHHVERESEYEIVVKGLTESQLKMWYALLKGGE